LNVPVASIIKHATGSWTDVLIIAALMNIIAAIAAIAVLRPVRLAEIKREVATDGLTASAPAG
jgi:MFS transporter, OFA family, oxalate/formate antiporter